MQQQPQDGIQRASVPVDAPPESVNHRPPPPATPIFRSTAVQSAPPPRPAAPRRSTAPRFLPLSIGALVIAGVVAVAVLFTSNTYTTSSTGVELGPARQHSASSLDSVARVTKGALDAAAGSAGVAPIQLSDGTPNADEKALLDLTNQSRASQGIAPLAFDPLLLAIARNRADSQLGSGPLSHYDALGQLAFAGLLSEANVPFTDAGENLARIDPAPGPVTPKIEQALMNSPTHRANILEPSYKTLAIGEANTTAGRLAFAEIFRAPPAGTASDSPPPPAPATDSSDSPPPDA